MNNIKNKIFPWVLFLIFCSLSFMSCSKTQDTMLEKVKQQNEEITESIKDAYEESKDDLCEMIDGKLQCAKKKIESEVKEVFEEKEEDDY